MTESEVINAIAYSVRDADTAIAQRVAKVALNRAVLKLSRMPENNFSREVVTIPVASGETTFVIGADILNKYPDIWGIMDLWRTDTPGWRVRILDVKTFNEKTRGISRTGAPLFATLHSSSVTLEVWPTPDKAYSLWGWVRKEISGFQDIPSIYHDIVIDLAIVFIQALQNPSIAVELARSGLDDMRKESLVGWTGSTIMLDRNIGKVVTSSDADSSNLTGV